MGDIVHMRGEGGSIIPMEPPFPEHIAARVATGHIVRVNPDGSDWTDEPVPTDVDTLDRVNPPKPAAAKADWVAYAQSQGMFHDDADAMTKAALVEKYGK